MYNKHQIEKNLMVFESSLNEVFAKMQRDYSDEVLNIRAETTLRLAEHVKESLIKYCNDNYIRAVIGKIDCYKKRYEEIKDKRPIAKEDYCTI